MSRPDFRHREALFQTLCAQLIREATGPRNLPVVAARVLNHPDVCRDAVLAAMLRSFIAEQESLLRRTSAQAHPEETEDKSQLHKPFEQLASTEYPTRPQLLKAQLGLRHDFEVYLAEYNETGACHALEKLEDLGRRFPVHIDAATVAACRSQFQNFQERCALYRRQVDDVARQAVEAARGGNAKTAAWLLRRLRAIHALTPVLLSAEHFDQLRAQIERISQQQAHREALASLIARERAVADRIKKAGAAIYRFHKATAELPPASEEYQRAQAAYRAAVEEVRQLDTEWLTGLLLELETYLDDLNDPQGRTELQLDRFIGTVRSALTQLRREIRAIREEREKRE